MCERELEMEQKLQHIDPHSSGYHSLSFPFSWAAQLGAWGPSLCWDMVLIPESSLQLIRGSEVQLLNRGSWGTPLLGTGSLYSILSPTNLNFLCTELYYCFTPTQFNPSTVKVIPWHPRLNAPVIYIGAFLILTAWLGWRSIYNTWNILWASLLNVFLFRLGVVVYVLHVHMCCTLAKWRQFTK